jgi:uncharacterized protein YecA (UPF0149 family)
VTSRKLTVQDILLIQKQLDSTQQLNQLLSEAITDIEEAVSGIDLAALEDHEAAMALTKVRGAIKALEKEVDQFTKQLK